MDHHSDPEITRFLVRGEHRGESRLLACSLREHTAARSSKRRLLEQFRARGFVVESLEEIATEDVGELTRNFPGASEGLATSGDVSSCLQQRDVRVRASSEIPGFGRATEVALEVLLPTYHVGSDEGLLAELLAIVTEAGLGEIVLVANIFGSGQLNDEFTPEFLSRLGSLGGQLEVRFGKGLPGRDRRLTSSG